MVSGELQWVLGLSQGLAGSVVLHVEGCVPPTPAAAASLQELVLEFPRGARGPKPYRLWVTAGKMLLLNNQGLRGVPVVTLSAVGWIRTSYVRLRLSSEYPEAGPKPWVSRYRQLGSSWAACRVQRGQTGTMTSKCGG